MSRDKTSMTESKSIGDSWVPLSNSSFIFKREVEVPSTSTEKEADAIWLMNDLTKVGGEPHPFEGGKKSTPFDIVNCQMPFQGRCLGSIFKEF